MRRKVAVGFCLVLGLGGIATWFSTKGSGRGDQSTPVEKDAEQEPPPRPSEKPLLDATVFGLPMQVAYFGNEEFSPCYVDSKNKTLHRCKGVILRAQQFRKTPYYGGISGISFLDSKDFSVVSIEAPVRYREVDGEYRVGHLDLTIHAFYECKGVVLSKKELLEKSSDGQDPILTPAFLSESHPKVIEFEMPAFLKGQPELWKKS